VPDHSQHPDTAVAFSPDGAGSTRVQAFEAESHP